MNDTKKQTLAIHLNFKKEIYKKIDDTKTSNSNNPLQFYIWNPFNDSQTASWGRRECPKNFINEIPLKMNRLKNPKSKKAFNYKLEIP